MSKIEQGITKNEIYPKAIENFIPDMESIYLLDTFFSKYRRIAFVSLYKLSVSRMSQDELQDLLQYELGQEVEIAIALGGSVLEMFNRDLFNPEVSAKDILVEENVYHSLDKIREQAMENPNLIAYMDRLSSVFESLIKIEDYRQLKDFITKYKGYISQILNRPEYIAALERRMQELSDKWMSLSADSNSSLLRI